MKTQKVLALIKKELILYFNSPTAYIVIFIFLLLAGFFYSRPLFVQNFATLRHFFDLLPLFLLFFVPAVTMKIYSEEYKVGTIEVIYTLPLDKLEILLSKFFATLFVVLVSIFLTFIYSISLLFLGRPDIGSIVSGYIGVILLCMFYVSCGVFSSSLTKNQIISFILAFFILFIFFAVGKLGVFVPQVISYAGIDLHYDNFLRGIVDFRDIVYFLSLTFLFLYLTYLVTQRQK